MHLRTKHLIEFIVFVLAVLSCMVNFVGGSETAEKVPCDVANQDEVAWTTADDGNLSVAVDIKAVCNSTMDTDGPVDVHPITNISLQQGSTVNFTSYCDGNITLYKLSDSGIDTWQLSEIMELSEINYTSWLVLDFTTSHTAVLPQHLLQSGQNVFICASGANFTVSCRLNITVKANECGVQTGDEVLCGGHGHCTTSSHEAVYTCKCCPGFTGDTCLQKRPHDTCTRDSCINGGTCIEADTNLQSNVSANDSSSIPTWNCACPPHVTGSRCETILNNCQSSPCVHGLCVERISGFQCYCMPGFHGSTCEWEYNECASNPCQNKGRCIDRLDKYECRCTPGHSGVNCEIKKDLCKPNPCARNVTCTDVGDKVHCECPAGDSGERCEHKINMCQSSPCHNYGTCVPLDHGFKCVCPVTFAGLHCEYMMDVFAPPMETGDFNGDIHKHNLYIVAGTLGTMVLIVVSVMIACYCKIYVTYKQLMWSKLPYHRNRSNSCPDLDSVGSSSFFRKPRLSVDGLLEATSLCHENAAYDSQSTTHSTSILHVCE